MSGEIVTIKLGLSDAERAARGKAIGGSDANLLMAGDENAIHDLWMRKTGQMPEPDLSDVLPVQIGVWTEPLNVRWFERITGRKVRSRNALCPHPKRSFMACNLDGLTTTESLEPAVFEAKHVNAFSNIDDVIQRYMGQVHHNMACAEVEHAILSVFVGTQKYEIAEIALDEWYLAQLIDREKAFWDCVERFEPPPRMKAVDAPRAVTALREVDMTASNFWCEQAAIYAQSLPHKHRNAAAEKELKSLVEADVKLAYGAGVRITRAKNAALTIRLEDQP